MSYEIECPVCDRKSPSSTTTCPHCGADLKMASFDDLEEMAVAIAAGKSSPVKSEARPIVPSPEVKPEPVQTKAQPEPEATKPASKASEPAPQPKADEAPAAEKPKEEKKDEGKKGLGRLFGKKKK
ncbi:MAG TPA: hypothetical protein VLU38_02915 [Methanomassiliicoccales archaeon]|nr:hypothetical protein [Methanomassiliicoccales archaeon]